MDFRKFNSIIDTIIEEETIIANERLSYAKGSYSKEIISIILEDLKDVLENLRIFPFYYNGAIKTKEEFEFYKQWKIRKIKASQRYFSNLTNTSNSSSLEYDPSIMNRKLKRQKEIIENAEYTGEEITYLDKSIFSCYHECSIVDLFKEDISELDMSLKSQYSEINTTGIDNLILSKIIQNEELFQKCVYYLDLKSEYDNKIKNSVHNFRFPTLKHLRFENTFYSLYPYVSEDNFMIICKDTRVNEYNSCLKNPLCSTTVERTRIYNNYIENYSPYENAMEFLRDKEYDFERDFKWYILAIEQLINARKHLSNDIKNNIFTTDLTEENSYLNDYEIEEFVKLKKRIKEFEKAYYIDKSILDDFTTMDNDSLLKKVTRVKDSIEKEFLILKGELKQVQQELIDMKNLYDKIQWRLDSLVLREEDLVEIENFKKYCNITHINEVSTGLRFGLSSDSGLKFGSDFIYREDIGFRYATMYTDFVLAKLVPEVRKYYHYNNYNESFTINDVLSDRCQMVDYEELDSFNVKRKLLEKLNKI